MGVCIPIIRQDDLNYMVAQHFSRAPTFTVVDIETNKKDIIANTGGYTGEAGLPLESIAKAGASIILCSRLGHRAVRMSEKFGISIITGTSGTMRSVIAAWQRGLLEEALNENACTKHRGDKT